MSDSSLSGHVGECAVAIVLEEMRSGLVARWKAFEARSVYQENIQPAVIVVIVKGDSAAGRFEQVFVFVLAAENCFDVQARVFGDVDEAHSNVGGLWRAAFRCRRLLKNRKGMHAPRPSKSQNIFERQHERGTAE